MGKGKIGRSVKGMERKEDREALRDLWRLDGVHRRRKRRVLAALAGLMLLGAAAFYFGFGVGSWQRLDIDKIVSIPQTGAIYDRDGIFVSRIQSSQNRVSIPLSDVPIEVQRAFLAAEDLRFYQHFGIDPVRIFGAVLSNLRAGDYAEGASTIPQQLVKLSQKTLARKLEEIYLALQLDARYSKDEILEMYLNFIYFGRGAYGIEAAAKAYYGVPARELPAAQGAALAAAVKAPSSYAPHLNPENNRQRQQYILRTMRDNGLLSEEACQAALAEDITPIEASGDETKYGWYVDAVLDEAESLCPSRRKRCWAAATTSIPPWTPGSRISWTPSSYPRPISQPAPPTAPRPRAPWPAWISAAARCGPSWAAGNTKCSGASTGPRRSAASRDPP